MEPDPAMAGSADPSADVADRDWLGRELIRLDIDQRAVIVLSYYLDLTMADVAETLDPATSKGRLAPASDGAVTARVAHISGIGRETFACSPHGKGPPVSGDPWLWRSCRSASR